MNNASAVLTIIVFFAIVALAAFFSIRWGWKEQKYRNHEEEQTRKIQLRCDPTYAQIEERDRAYQLARERQTQELALQWASHELTKQQQMADLTLKQAEFQLNRYLSLTRIPPETYLTEEPTCIIPLPSLKRVPEPVKEDDPDPSPAAYQQPSLETIIEELVPNGLEFVYGADTQTGELVKTTLPRSVHIQLLGASGQGKSRQATSILTQLTAKNDPQHLQLALIDCENETTAPFHHLPHVRYLADEPKEAAKTLHSLVGELERRDKVKIISPVLLIFVEEFLNLRRTMPETYRDQALEDYTSLALRGRKRGMFLFSIGQTSYTEKSIRDAQLQFLSSMAFAIKPTAARSAGFTNTELLNKLYSERRPGQFLLERPTGDGILLAPYVDVNRIANILEKGISQCETEPLVLSGESQSKVNRNPMRNPIEPALEAKLEQILSLLSQGITNKADIILAVWEKRAGKSEMYKQAEEEYTKIMQYISSLVTEKIEA